MSDMLPGLTDETRSWIRNKLSEIESAVRKGEKATAISIIEESYRELENADAIEGTEINWRRTTLDRAKQKVTAIGASIGKATDNVTALAQSGAARVSENLSDAVDYISNNRKDIIESSVAGVAAGFSVAHNAFVEFASNLDWNALVDSGSTEYLNRFITAGTRGIDRTLDQAQLVWETIPESLRALGPEEVSKHLWGAESAADRFDWSHRIPHSEGGSDEAINGIFELATTNRSRGAEIMTQVEYDAAAQVLADTAFRAALVETASRVFEGAAVGAAVSLILASLEYGLEYQRGEITREEMLRRIGRDVAKATVIGAAVAGVMSVVALAFPGVIPLAALIIGPLAILGFCAVGGKVVRLGKGWYDVYRETLADDVPSLRLEYQAEVKA